MSSASINCRVVLVRTEIAGNLGATARVMRNLGLSDLVLVAPVASIHDRQARQMSTHGEEILDRCRVVADLGEAVADCVAVAGTSARAAGVVRHTVAAPPAEVMPLLVEAMASGPVALVFGPEPSGLSNAEMMRCGHLVTVPADEAYPALNLAQAVAICLYELRLAWLRREAPAGPAPEVASYEELERAFTHLQEALERAHFLYDERGPALMHALRHLIGRARPSPGEVRILHGLARQILWLAERAGPK